MARTGRILKYHNERIRIVDIARMTTLSEACVWQRLKSGWSVERIINTPLIPVQDRHRLRKSNARSGRYSWLVHDEDSTVLSRRLLLERAKRQDPEALAKLRKMGMLTWQRADLGVIL